VTVRKGFTRTEAFDIPGLAASIQSQFGFDATSSRALAVDLLRSAFTIRISPGVTVRGIDRIEFQGLRSLWVYGN
jgi:hypothetical protein